MSISASRSQYRAARHGGHPGRELPAEWTIAAWVFVLAVLSIALALL
ncbi:hypothetical protein [Nocardia beijingensis]|uniref:Uncharacterized protein n=1 Tax=Nocardia beijingensis TaxID=95162 RepID=A0ABW7WF43_9NOCA